MDGTESLPGLVKGSLKLSEKRKRSEITAAAYRSLLVTGAIHPAESCEEALVTASECAGARDKDPSWSDGVPIFG